MDGPVVLAMREDDLEAPLREVLSLRPRDVVVTQNGWIDPLLEEREVTRAVLWFTAKGDFFASARETVIGGPWAAAMARWIREAGAPAREVSPAEALREAREKAAWSCLVGPAIAAWGLPFSEALAREATASRGIIEESCSVASRALGTSVSPEGAWAMVEQTVGPLGWMRGGTRGLRWRTGQIVRWAEETLGDGMAAIRSGEVLRALGGA